MSYCRDSFIFLSQISPKKTTLKQYFGPDYYSFNRGKVHYVILDDVFCVGRGSAAIVYLPEEQLRWLEQDLSRIKPGGTVVVSFHIPTYTREARNKEWSKTCGSLRAVLARGRL